jgi:hypothetical protein
MRFARALVVGVAVVAFLGSTSASDLAPLLLTESDLPSGWSAQTVASNGDAAMPTRGLCGGPSLAARAHAAGTVGHAHATFIRDPFVGPVLSESVWTFTTPSSAGAFMRSIRRAAVRCGHGDHLDPASGRRSMVTVTAAASSLSGDTLGVVQTSSAPTVTTAGISLYVRAEDVVLVLTTTGYTLERALTKHLAQRALDKLGPALR